MRANELFLSHKYNQLVSTQGGRNRVSRIEAGIYDYLLKYLDENSAVRATLGQSQAQILQSLVLPNQKLFAHKVLKHENKIVIYAVLYNLTGIACSLNNLRDSVCEIELLQFQLQAFSVYIATHANLFERDLRKIETDRSNYAKTEEFIQEVEASQNKQILACKEEAKLKTTKILMNIAGKLAESFVIGKAQNYSQALSQVLPGMNETLEGSAYWISYCYYLLTGIITNIPEDCNIIYFDSTEIKHIYEHNKKEIIEITQQFIGQLRSDSSSENESDLPGTPKRKRSTIETKRAARSKRASKKARLRLNLIGQDSQSSSDGSDNENSQNSSCYKK